METQSFEVQKTWAIERLARLEDEEVLLLIMHLLTAAGEVDGPPMSEAEFRKFIADRLREAEDPANHVPGNLVLENLRARFSVQAA